MKDPRVSYEKTRSAPLYWLYVTRMVNGVPDKIVFQTRDSGEQDAEFERLNAGGAEQQWPVHGTRIAHRQQDGSVRYEQMPEPVRGWF